VNSPTSFVILAANQPSGAGGLAPIGPRDRLLRDLFDCNTGPQREGEDILYGPGIRIELPPGQDPVTQMLLTLTEPDIGWQVLMRLAKRWGWKVLDPNTGREFTPGQASISGIARA
jgi:hypothetical protein